MDLRKYFHPMTLAVLVLTFASFAQVADAQEDVLFDVLVPVFQTEEKPGAHGSIWYTELWMRNSLDEEVFYVHCVPCFSGVRPPSVAPRTTAEIGRFEGTTDAAMLHLGHEVVDDVHLSLRVFEKSQGVIRQGVEIPVIREDEFLRKPVELLAVPVGEGSRSTLRLYDPRGRGDVVISIEVFENEGESLLGSMTVRVNQGRVRAELDPQITAPSTFTIFDLATELNLPEDTERVRVRLTPLNDREYWGFISITDNDNQYVSLVTPQ